MTSTAQRYPGKVTPVGNSKGIRLGAAFFRAHPEFDGEVEATVLGEGQVLLSARARKTRRAQGADEPDPLVLSFLRFLEDQMRKHPQRIRPLDAGLLDEIANLVKGVKVE
ncbi:MAG: type II toxin-antitoxin system PrlF family antitoxin [Burkholderiales bacterium]